MDWLMTVLLTRQKYTFVIFLQHFLVIILSYLVAIVCTNTSKFSVIKFFFQTFYCTFVLPKAI